MKKIDTTVIRETRYIALFVLALSAVMQGVFLICGKWDITVLLGNLLIGFAVILNFFLMGLTVQKAVTQTEKEAKKTVKVSMLLRNIMMFAFLAIAVFFRGSVFNIWASLIPVTFPRIAIFCSPLFRKKTESPVQGGENQ